MCAVGIIQFNSHRLNVPHMYWIKSTYVALQADVNDECEQDKVEFHDKNLRKKPEIIFYLCTVL